MGSKWFTDGVVAAGRSRIQFDFVLDGIRYRPSIKRPPSEANLRRARERLEVIKRQIEAGTFSFEEEFPLYRFLGRLSGTSNARLYGGVFDDFLSHCAARCRRDDLSPTTLRGYRKVLDGIWRPKIGHLAFFQIRYSQLVAIADQHRQSKKTFNNVISVLRCAFEFGYRDRPLQENPARSLRCVRLTRADRPKVDPFSMHDAELLIAGIHRDWGEAQGNYDEFRFFTGLRPSEQIALTLSVLKRHLRLRERLEAAGKIDHSHVFFLKSGEPIRNLSYPARRWRKTSESLQLRYRRPYVARHSSVSWNLMLGKNLRLVTRIRGRASAEGVCQVHEAARFPGLRET